jgi:hypothetical protein
MLRVLMLLPLLLALTDPKPQPPSPYRVDVLPCAEGATSCKVIARWTAGANYNPATDSTRVVWRNTALAPNTAPLRRAFTDGTSDSLTVTAPPIGTPLNVSLQVCTLRTGFPEAACAPIVTFPVESQGEIPNPPSGVTVTPASATIRQDQTLHLTARPAS